MTTDNYDIYFSEACGQYRLVQLQLLDQHGRPLNNSVVLDVSRFEISKDIDNKFITDKSQIIDVNIEHLDAKNNILVLRLTRVSSITTDVDVKIYIDYDGEEILTCYVLVYDAFLTGAEISIAPISSDVEISVTDSLVEYTADPTNPPNMTN